MKYHEILYVTSARCREIEFHVTSTYLLIPPSYKRNFSQAEGKVHQIETKLEARCRSYSRFTLKLETATSKRNADCAIKSCCRDAIKENSCSKCANIIELCTS